MNIDSEIQFLTRTEKLAAHVPGDRGAALKRMLVTYQEQLMQADMIEFDKGEIPKRIEDRLKFIKEHVISLIQQITTNK